MNNNEFDVFKRNVSSLIGLDLFNYKNTQLERRVRFFMNKHGVSDLSEFYHLLKKNEDKLQEFVNMLTINVTEFFRNEDKFLELEKIIIPSLIKDYGKSLKIWSAGCSSGAEIYSIAMIMDKLGALDKCKLIASDFDENIIKRAKTAEFSKFELNEKTFNKFQKYFTFTKESTKEVYKLSNDIASRVTFKKQDLLNKSSFEKDFHLILCRNVVIYFTEDAKDTLYKNFYNSLVNGGILFIGTTERINNHKELGFDLLSSFFYKK